MPTRTPPSASSDLDFEPPLHVIRGHRIILDADLARLYGVPTMRLNEAVKRNVDRFPSDFVFQLIPEEWEALMRSQSASASPSDPNLSQIAIGSRNDPGWSQSVTASPENGEISENTQGMRSQNAIASPKENRAKRNDRYLPWAFTEHGALMAGTLLRSPRAVQMSLYIVRAFVKLRQIALENENLSRRMTEAELALRAHDVILTDIYDKLEPLLDPEPAEAKPEPDPKRKLGFETEPA